MSEYDENYYLTLHVDLLNTVLDDFMIHAEWTIRDIASLGLLNVLDDQGGQWKEVESHDRPTLNTVVSQWVFEKSAGDFSIYISSTRNGNTSCKWSGTYPLQGFWPGNKRYGQGKSDFTIEATHYRRDRLNVAMWESPKDNPVLADSLMRWLKQYWREGEDGGVMNLLKKEGVLDPEIPEDRRRRVYKENDARATLVQYLVANHGGTLDSWCGVVNISPTTYRTMDDEGLLLTPEQFQRKFIVTLENAAKTAATTGALPF